MSRPSCYICSSEHIRSARKYLWEIEKDIRYAFDVEDPHFEGFMEELAHAEQQTYKDYPQVFERIRSIKKAFEDVTNTAELLDVLAKECWWVKLTMILHELRELREIDKAAGRAAQIALPQEKQQ